jgi:hypothetical protein
MVQSRITHKTVTFGHPFHLHGHLEMFPPGSYVVDTTEELIESVSFTAYRRTSTDLHIVGKHNGMLVDRIININPIDLDFALAQDTGAAIDPST